jgi:hypothetical protein
MRVLRFGSMPPRRALTVALSVSANDFTRYTSTRSRPCPEKP